MAVDSTPCFIKYYCLAVCGKQAQTHLSLLLPLSHKALTEGSLQGFFLFLSVLPVPDQSVMFSRSATSAPAQTQGYLHPASDKETKLWEYLECDRSFTDRRLKLDIRVRVWTNTKPAVVPRVWFSDSRCFTVHGQLCPAKSV